jgi:hypothetical protein
MMAEEDEAKAGLVNKGKDYPKTSAKPTSTAEFVRTFQFLVWPPTPDDEHFESALAQWQDAARAEGLMPAKTADMTVTGEGGLTFIEVVGRVKKATAKES